jgi:hypothetical protein
VPTLSMASRKYCSSCRARSSSDLGAREAGALPRARRPGSARACHAHRRPVHPDLDAFRSAGGGAQSAVDRRPPINLRALSMTLVPRDGTGRQSRD